MIRNTLWDPMAPARVHAMTPDPWVPWGAMRPWGPMRPKGPRGPRVPYTDADTDNDTGDDTDDDINTHIKVRSRSAQDFPFRIPHL